MGRIERSIEIKAPPEKVWEMLALDRASEWNEGSVKNVEYTTEVSTPKDKYRVGASAHATIKGEVHFEITESLENTKITIQAKGGKTSPRYMLNPERLIDRPRLQAARALFINEPSHITHFIAIG